MTRPDLSLCPVFRVTFDGSPECWPRGALVEGTLAADGRVAAYCANRHHAASNAVLLSNGQLQPANGAARDLVAIAALP